MNSKSAVDRHVSHILSKCNSAKERQSLGLEISKLYIDVKDYKSAKSYLDRYLRSNPRSSVAYVLLASINEETSDVRGALHAYRAAFELGCEDIALIEHACNLASSNALPSRDLEFWSNFAISKGLGPPAQELQSQCEFDEENRIILAESQLKKDPTNTQLCLRFMGLLSEFKLFKRLAAHCLNCINNGHHFDSLEWFQSCVELLDGQSEPQSEDTLCLEIISQIFVLRLGTFNDSEDFYALLESLHSKIQLLDTKKGYIRLRNVSESWLCFCSAIYVQQFFDIESAAASDVVCENYRRSIQLCLSQPEKNNEPFSPLVWNSLHIFQAANKVQAWCLSKSLLGSRSTSRLFEVSWSDLMGMLPSKIKSVTKESKTLGTGPVTLHTLDSDGFWSHCCDALLEVSDNLKLLLWSCFHLTKLDSRTDDVTLSDQRLDFIFKFVTAAFPRLELCSPPLPAASKSLTTPVVCDGPCQMDLVCFLLCSLINLSVRSLSRSGIDLDQHHYRSAPTSVIDCTGIPISLLPSHLTPTASQQKWWELATDLIKRNVIQSTVRSKPTRQCSTFFQCGLHQLRLFTRPARCFGNQNHVLSSALLFRVAHALTRLAERFASAPQKHHILDWANGYWQKALQQHTFGPPPPNTTLVAQSRPLPACSGSGSLLNENQICSPCSPRRSVNLMVPGSPATNHSLFALPGSTNWWLGMGQPSIKDATFAISEWYNKGLRFCSNRLSHAYEANGQHLTPDEKCELRLLIRLLDQSKVDVDSEVYLTVGKLLLHHAERAEGTTDQSILDSTGEGFLLSGERDPLTDSLRAERYLKLSAVISEVEDDDYDLPVQDLFNNSSTNHHQSNQTTPIRPHKDSCKESYPTAESSVVVPPSTNSGQPTSDALLLRQFCNFFEAMEGYNIFGTTVAVNNPDIQQNVSSCISTIAADADDAQFDNLPQFQEFLMASFMNNWQTLINSLSCQLSEAKAEMARSRQLNEQLSTQLNETSKQLSETMTKFIEFQAQITAGTKTSNGRDMTPSAAVHDALAGPIRELSQAIGDLRRWLPEGMAAAATAAVSAHISNSNQLLPPPSATASARPGPLLSGADAATLMQLYGPNLPFNPAYLNSLNQIPIQSLPPNWRMSGVAPATLPPNATPGNLRSVHKPNVLPTAPVPWSEALGTGIRFGDPNHVRLDQPGLLSDPGVPGAQNFPLANYGWSGSSPPNRDTSHNSQSESFPDDLRINVAKPGNTVLPVSSIPSRVVGPNASGLQQSSLDTTQSRSDDSSTAAGMHNKSANSSFSVPDKPKPMPEVGLFRPTITIDSSDGAAGPLNSGMELKATNTNATVGKPNERPSIAHPWSGPATTSSNEPRSTVGSVNQSGDLLSRFAPKPGEWSCSVCMVQNSPSNSKCAACQTPKVAPSEKTNLPTDTSSSLSKFAPQPGSWNCPTCMLNHSSGVMTCPACHTHKPGTSSSTTGSQTTNPLSKPSLGANLFKNFNTPSPGGFVFGQPKTTTPTASTPTKPLFSFVAGGTKSPANPPVTSPIPTAPDKGITSKPDQTYSSPPRPVFHFGTKDQPLTGTETSKSSGVFDKLELTKNPIGKPIFGTGNFSFNFGLPKTTESSTGKSGVNTSTNVTSVSDQHSDADQVELVDEDKLTFKPVLEVMPEKVEVRTGEENEEVIFHQRAKLYRWTTDTWRERGVGEMKLLRTPTTGAVRCLMRRDHVLKVCCNHPITVGMQLKPMSSATDGRAWTWWAIDFTEPSTEADADQSQHSGVNVDTDTSGGRRETFAIRFKEAEHAKMFKNAFDSAVLSADKRAKGQPAGGASNLVEKLQNVDLDKDKHASDVDDVIVCEKPPEVSDEQLARARQLMLPDEFYSFENGVRRGESENLTAAEEAVEDELLEAAVRRGIPNSRPDTVSVSSHPSTPVTASGDVKTSSSTFKMEQPSDEKDKSTTGVFGTLSLNPKGNPLSTTYVPQLRGLSDFSSLSASVSKDAKPSWGTPSGSTTNASIWSNAGTPLFAKSTPSEPTTTEDNGTAEETSDHDPHYDPIIALPELVQAKSGEEGEVCLFLKRCRVYRFAENAWKERGIGEMKVLVQPKTIPEGYTPGGRDVLPNDVQLNDVQRARLLMRREQVLKICVNQPIGVEIPQFTPMGSGGNNMCWVGEDYSDGSAALEKLAIRFKLPSDAEEFKAAVARAQSFLEKASN